MRIINVMPQNDYSLLVFTDDGREGVFDVRPYLDCEVFVPLRQPTEFMKVRNGGYFVEWECGADLSADTLEFGLRQVSGEPVAALGSKVSGPN